MSNSEKYGIKPHQLHTMIKTEIVAKYFTTWSQILGRKDRKLAYIDLYAGAGKYENGHFSTALRVALSASKNKYLREKLVLIINDKKKSNWENNLDIFEEKELYSKFSIKPAILNMEVNSLMAQHFRGISMIPTLCFIDPFGYKGVSVELIRSVIKDHGCDCIVFLSTSGVNRNISNPACRDDMEVLFGKECFESILPKIKTRNISGCKIIIDEFIKACKHSGAKYVREMQFNFPNSENISHHLIFLTKHSLGFKIMKDIMSDYSQLDEDTIPQYKYVDGRNRSEKQLNFQIGGSMDELKRKLIEEFNDSKLLVKDLVESCHENGWIYTTKNIKDALIGLEEEKRILDVTPNGKNKKEGTFGDKRKVGFLYKLLCR